jgi:hypothetical protein
VKSYNRAVTLPHRAFDLRPAERRRRAIRPSGRRHRRMPGGGRQREHSTNDGGAAAGIPAHVQSYTGILQGGAETILQETGLYVVPRPHGQNMMGRSLVQMPPVGWLRRAIADVFVRNDPNFPPIYP